MWGEFTMKDGTIHVVPVDEEEEPALPHTPDLSCVCHPEVDPEDDTIIIHNQLH